MQTSHGPFIIIRIFALHNLLQKSSRDAFFSITFSCTESRSKDHCSALLVISHSALFWITAVFLFLFILLQTSNLTSYSPLVLLFYSAGPYRSLSVVALSGFPPFSEWESAHKRSSHSSQIEKSFFGQTEGKASWDAHTGATAVQRPRGVAVLWW